MTVCGAASFLPPGGPVPVPLRACCAAAIVRASAHPSDLASAVSASAVAPEIRPAPFVCRATDTPAPASSPALSAGSAVTTDSALQTDSAR